MGLAEAFRSALYKEPVMCWSLMIYASGLSWVTLIRPNLAEPHSKELPKAPPSLQEVMAGIQAKLNK
ncbi:hypothetical protein PLESTF_001428800 [Pleodorina starrii]|nr:hypothetical protein PLESTF_001428800 [Pleodorina starrii]